MDPIIKNGKTLKEIQNEHPNGIYTVEEFVKEIKPGKKFYIVKASAETGISPHKADEKCGEVLESLNPYEGDFEDYKNSFECKLQGKSGIRFLEDFLSLPNGVFLNLEDAKKNKTDLYEHWGKIISLT